MFTNRLFYLLILVVLLVVTACAPQVAPTSTIGLAQNQTWAEDLLPNGVWQVELTADDLEPMGLLRGIAEDWSGVRTWSFKDGKAHTEYIHPTLPTENFTCDANLELVEDFVRFTYVVGGYCKGDVDDIQWGLEEDGLHLHLVAITGSSFAENQAYL
jgi:hypothetical protein